MTNEFIKLLKPQNVFIPKKRLGPSEDGGYVLPEFVFENCTALFTYGVGNDVRFEEEFSRTYKKPSFLFDHTIGREEWHQQDNLHFYPEGLGFGENCADFNEHYKKYHNDGYVCLKIDIEGHEYEYFKNLDVSKYRSTVMGFIFEVHWVSDQRYRDELSNLLEKLNHDFILCHIHGNNWGVLWDFNGINIPDVIELSFINRKFVDRYEPDSQDYPIKGLDVPNNPNSDDFALTFLK